MTLVNQASYTTRSKMDNFSNCTAERTTEYIIIAAVNSGLNGLTLIACLTVIGLIIVLKKYMVSTQRLILYLCIATALDSLVSATQATVYFPVNDAYRAYCVVTGFLSQVTGWATILAYCCITTELFLKTVVEVQTKIRYEWIYGAVILIGPFVLNWIPFIENTYGEAGPWCWIRDTNNDETCSRHYLGFVLRLALWYVPLYLVLFLILIFYIIIIVAAQRNVRKFTGKFDPATQSQKILIAKKVKPLILYPLLFIFGKIFAFINRVHDTITDEQNIVLFWLQAVITPISGAAIVIVYVLDPQTRKTLRQWKSLVTAIKNCLFQKDFVSEYKVEQGNVTDSLKD